MPKMQYDAKMKAGPPHQQLAQEVGRLVGGQAPGGINRLSDDAASLRGEAEDRAVVPRGVLPGQEDEAEAPAPAGPQPLGRPTSGEALREPKIVPLKAMPSTGFAP